MRKACSGIFSPALQCTAFRAVRGREIVTSSRWRRHGNLQCDSNERVLFN